MGRVAVVAGAERAAQPPRLVFDDGPAGRARRLHGGQCAVPVSARHADAVRLPGVGLALSVLRRLRHQRGGALRQVAPGRH
ncbi:hypothetical protein G6F57_021034 [Rhizopus arrhizus]|nr:hypothetical protein G6F57_021034 [Rhizopus arrhizus]